jgi:cytochrome bd-type quinol oxidase subunit 1
MDLLTSQPLWLSGTLLIGVTTLVAMAGPVIIRRCVPLEQLRLNNEVAGFKFATVGVLYAVLLAFAVIIVWEKFSEAEDAATREAGAVATLFRLADGLGAEAGHPLRTALTTYAEVTIAQDWPAMEEGTGSVTATRALDATYASLLRFAPKDERGTVMMSEALNQLDQVTQARRLRHILAPGSMPGVLWFVLSVGAVATIGFTLFFGTENLRIQAIMTGILTFLICSALLVIIATDQPFTGTVKVQPEAMAAVLEDFARKEP